VLVRGKKKEGSYVMKRSLFVCLLLCMAIFAFADEAQTSQKIAIGAGLEFNMNSRDNFAAGAVLAFDFSLGSSFAVGFTVSASYNFDGITVIEPAALFRWYFLGSNGTGWFVQADAGAYLVFEDEDITPLFLGGIRGGLRLPVSDMFFIEPFGRIGYPFMFGFGVLAGIRF